MKISKRINALFVLASLTCAPTIASASAVVRIENRRVAAAQQDGDPSTAEQELFLQAQRLYEKNQYDQAVKTLRELLRTYPRSSITDLTLLWLARSYIGLNNLPEAERVGGQLRQIKDSPFLDIYQSEFADAQRKSGAGSIAANNTSGAQSARPTPGSTPRLITGERSAATEPTASEANSTVRNRTTAGLPAAPRTALRNRPSRRTGEPSEPNRTANIRPAVTQRATSVASNANGNVAAEETRRAVVSATPASSPTDETARGASGSGGGSVSTITSNDSSTPTTPEQSGGTFVVTIKQVPNLSLALRNNALPASPGQTVSLPLTITNTGNKEDQFRVETDLPAEFQPTFSNAPGASDTGLPILVTPQVPRGGTYDVMLNLRVPETIGDGQQRPFIVRAASQFDTQVERTATAAVNVVAAALAATSGVSQPVVQPGETFAQTIQIRNQGSAPARQARAEFVFDQDFELVSATPSPLVYDRASRTAVWSLGELGARDKQDVTVNLRAVGDALAASSKPLGRGTLRTASLPVPSNFDGPNVTVGRVARARIDSVSVGQTATPGDTIYVPFVIRNPSNYPEAFELRITAPGAPAGVVYADTNGDGQHQDGEPAITQTGSIEARGGQYPVLLRVEIPRSTPDRQQFGYNIVARSITNNRVASEGSTVLTVAAPRVRIRTEQTDSNAESGDSIFYRLVLVNEGAGIARNLVVNEQLPAELQFVNSDPALTAQDAPGGGQRLTWRVADLAPADTAVLRIAVRLRPGLNANTTLRTQRELVYQDGNGNNHRGQ